MRRLLLPLVGIFGFIVGAAVVHFADRVDGGSPAAAHRVAAKSLDPSGVADSASFAARETFEVTYEPEALCPSRVPAERGYVFHCQADMEGVLVPVAVRVSSPLGFYSIESVNGIPWRR